MTEGKRETSSISSWKSTISSLHGSIQDALKDLLGGTIEMMEAEMDDHLGYEKSGNSDNDDYRNGYSGNRST